LCEVKNLDHREKGSTKISTIVRGQQIWVKVNFREKGRPCFQSVWNALLITKHTLHLQERN